MGDKPNDSVEEFKLDHVKEGIIDALVRGQRPIKNKSNRVVRRRQASSDKNQLPLF